MTLKELLDSLKALDAEGCAGDVEVHIVYRVLSTPGSAPFVNSVTKGKVRWSEEELCWVPLEEGVGDLHLTGDDVIADAVLIEGI